MSRKPSSVALDAALKPPYRLGKDNLELLWETNGETLEEIKKEAGKMKGSVLDLFRDEMKDERIQGAVETMRDDGKSDEQIVERLMNKYGLKKDEAEGYVLVPA